MALGLIAATTASAKPEFWETFKAHYHPADGSAIGEGRCLTCHMKGSTERNPYGKALQRLVDASAGKKVTDAMLLQVEALDADKDGFKNIDEIKAGSLPGDPNSVPSRQGPTPSAPLIPAHSFHPLIVHFPIGIFLFGACFDIVGALAKKPSFRTAGRLAILIGSLAEVFAVCTGLLAMLRMEKPLEGTLLIHMICGVSACILGLASAGFRLKEKDSPTSGPAYWLILGLASIALILAGHFGSSMVWG
jgi:uncharacterized membrane protein